MSLIGARLRDLRQNRNLTLKQVADETGFALSFLSLIERDKVSINVDNLARLARFYGVRMVHFFQSADESPILVTRRGEIASQTRGVGPASAEFRLLAHRADARMEPLLIAIGPGHGDPHYRTHDGDSLLYVAEGRVRLLTEGEETVELAAGDCAYYFGFPGRRIENASPEHPAAILLVTTPPTTLRDDVADATSGVLIQSEEM
ncbi:MAG: helix-turn-helix domain-containing protein [Chloroflexi bacterium]|nr:helix-turn-helix domain-containing protein [Chloroflexota bacterium]